MSIEIQKISITDVNTDAVVNAANEGLWAGGGVCGAIFKAAGKKELQDACNAIGHCDTGSAVITPGFNLSKYIIHAVGPVWHGGSHREPQQLYGAYRAALRLAAENNCKSIAFPLISAGIFGYPVDKAWRKALQACLDFDYKEIQIIFAVLDDNIIRIGRETLAELTDGDNSVIDSVEASSRMVLNKLEPERFMGEPGEVLSEQVTGRDAKKKARAFKDTVVKAVDKNEDGEIDVDDLRVIARGVGSVAKTFATTLRDTTFDGRSKFEQRIEQTKRELERKLLAPLFAEDLLDSGFSMPKLIRISEIDKRHSESELCKGSIGHKAVFNDVPIVNIYPDCVDSFGLTFYPDLDSNVYYVDPSNSSRYIALDDYFNYLKIARINELQKIAQDLGAKHFRVVYREEKKSLSSKQVALGVNAKGAQLQNGKVDFNHNSSSQSFSKIEVAAEMECVGHEPVKPELVYFRNDTSIKSLINLRMSDDLIHQKYTLNCSNSTGIRVSDAGKIDGALAAMKCSGNASVKSEAESEARRSFEYEIDF